MSGRWLHVIGIGADGMESLSPAARAALEAAEVVVGGERHHGLTEGLTAERIAWPSPFDALIGQLKSLRGRRVAVLATGDPLWFSVGARIGRALPVAEIAYHPQLSAFQLAAARLGWSLADCETVSVHGRPVEGIIPFLQPGARLIALTSGAETPAAVAALMAARGYGESRLVALSDMGTDAEQRIEGTAAAWPGDVPPFNTLAIDCVAGPEAAVAPRVPGLADALFEHDGTMTKREVRAMTLARLAPTPGALLWDVGCGCGSVAIEWMRAAPWAKAVGIEPRADRRALSAANAAALGAPGLRVIAGEAPAALEGLDAPDAVFVGGGLSRETVAAALAALKPGGRLVANAVTVESETVLAALHAEKGGELVRVSVARADAVGGRTGWRPFMPVTQWSLGGSLEKR
jgi:precorrin-6Y C5,15-methyltransferase (decarboxylating)